LKSRIIFEAETLAVKSRIIFEAETLEEKSRIIFEAKKPGGCWTVCE
jgi:hypothetical protein